MYNADSLTLEDLDDGQTNLLQSLSVHYFHFNLLFLNLEAKVDKKI